MQNVTIRKRKVRRNLAKKAGSILSMIIPIFCKNRIAIMEYFSFFLLHHFLKVKSVENVSPVPHTMN